MKNTRAEELMAAYLSGNIATTEREELLAWVSDSSEGQKFFDNAVTLWSLTEQMAYPDFSANKTAVWQKVDQRLVSPAMETKANKTAKVRSLGGTSWWAVAAAVSLLLVAGWWLLQPTAPTAVIASTLNDERSDLTLPDGTVVWLNENTYFTYENVEGERQVHLSGEAFFDVATDSLQPFRIYTDDAITTVLGTSFNIRAYPEEEQVEVSVKEGKVALEPKAKKEEVAEATVQRVELLPGDKGVFVKETTAIATKEEQAKNSTAWKDGKLDFDAVPLAEVVEIVERYYEVEIELADERLGRCLLYGKYENLPLEELLQLIEITAELEMEENDGIYRFSGEACE